MPADNIFVDRPRGGLLSYAKPTFPAALARTDAAPQLFEFCAKYLIDRPGMAGALANDPNCPPELLAATVPHMTTAVLQGLMADLDRPSSTPALASAPATSPFLVDGVRLQLQ